MILRQVSFILYKYLKFPRSTKFFHSKNVKQWVHLKSSKKAGDFKFSVTPAEGSHLEKIAIMIVYNLVSSVL
jgi:hypothetical protein